MVAKQESFCADESVLTGREGKVGAHIPTGMARFLGVGSIRAGRGTRMGFPRGAGGGFLRGHISSDGEKRFLYVDSLPTGAERFFAG